MSASDICEKIQGLWVSENGNMTFKFDTANFAFKGEVIMVSLKDKEFATAKYQIIDENNQCYLMIDDERFTVDHINDIEFIYKSGDAVQKLIRTIPK